MPKWDDFILKIAVRLRNANGEIAKRVVPEASALDFRGAVTGKGGGKSGKGSKGGKGADSGKGGKGKGKGAGKGAQGARPPWGCHVCGNTEKKTRDCGCGPCTNCPGSHVAGSWCMGAPDAGT